MKLNSELVKLARERIKTAFVPIDPAAAQAPPAGAPPAPPMDPAAMGAPPPMDPAAMGVPPAAPAAPAGAPPAAPAGAPPVNGQPLVVGLDDLIQLFMDVSGGAAGAGAAAGTASESGGNEPKPAEGAKADEGDKLDQVLKNQEQLINILAGAAGTPPAPPGAAGAVPESMGMGVPGMAEPTPPEFPAAPAAGAAPAPAPGMTVAASENALSPKRADERVSSINRVMNNLLNNGRGRRS